jgi:uncharacterized protein YoxC
MGGVAALICAASFALVMLTLAIVVLKLAKTMSITNGILNDIRKEAVPLMGKFQTTMDHVNDEMGYVDSILHSGQKLAERMNTMTKAMQQVVSSPLVRILSLGVGVQKALGTATGRKEGDRAGTEED